MYSSLNIDFVNLVPFLSIPSARSLVVRPSVLPRASLVKTGSASGSETARKPLALRPSLYPPFRVPPGQKYNTTAPPAGFAIAEEPDSEEE
jgi:hypothetical protein